MLGHVDAGVTTVVGYLVGRVGFLLLVGGDAHLCEFGFVLVDQLLLEIGSVLFLLRVKLAKTLFNKRSILLFVEAFAILFVNQRHLKVCNIDAI